jgi:hypothetical protein
MMKLPAALSGLEDLFDFGHGNGIDMRPTLLRVLTDLYLQRPTHTPDDERYYTELALRLIEAADIPQRTALARRLAHYPAAPRPVIERLGRDTIEVAAPVLTHSACLSPADLAAIAQQLGGAHAEAVAARPPTPPAGDPSPGESTTATTEARELAELFFSAAAEERRLILINLDYASLAPAAPLSELQRADIWRMESAVLQHNIDTVVRELERTLGIARTLARQVVEDELGEPIVVAAKALELPADVLQRMLLFLNPRIGQSVDRVYELARLYGEISVEAARRLVAIWRGADESESRPVQHEPVAWRTAAENARRTLSEVSRRQELQRDARLRRGRER